MKKLEKGIYYALNLGDEIVKFEITNHKQEFWEEDVYEFETEKVEHNLIDIVVHYNGTDYTTIDTINLNKNANGLIFFKNFEDAKNGLIDRIKENIDYLTDDDPEKNLKAKRWYRGYDYLELKSYEEALKNAMELIELDVRWG